MWLLTGIYIVGGNERAVVRRFGRAVTNPDGELVLKRNGLHYDWPWPFSQVDRVNLNEIRTLTIPLKTAEPEIDTQLLGETLLPEPAFLTGDKNLLNVYLAVQYRVDEERVSAFLYGSADRESRLACLTETTTANLLAQSGVDYIQVSGLAAWRQELTRQLQRQVEQQQLGIIIEDVSLDEIAPPIQVKADFLDVANARAEREQYIQTALSSADQRRQSAKAEAREIHDTAQSQARKTRQAAEGAAARFVQLVRPFQLDPNSSDFANRKLSRRLALERYYYQSLAEILERIKGQVLLDTGQPVDLTILGSPKSESPEPSTENDQQTKSPPKD
ncbi:MAG: hypothetical protein KDA84_26530 [Planctomycetaceae bacterium]|nr:hypothetical protein [Planctomycetaceae bacterium]